MLSSSPSMCVVGAFCKTKLAKYRLSMGCWDCLHFLKPTGDFQQQQKKPKNPLMYAAEQPRPRTLWKVLWVGAAWREQCGLEPGCQEIGALTSSTLPVVS